MGNQLDDNYGSKCMAIPFAHTGDATGGFKLSDITPINGENINPEDMINTVYFQLLDNGGVNVPGSDRFWDGEKWVNGSSIDKSEETYESAAGLYFYNQSYNSQWDCGNVTLQSAGEVIQKNVIVDLDDDYGSVVIGNPFPMPIKLKDIIPYVDNASIIDNTIYFQKLDNGGVNISGSDRYWAGGKWVDISGNDMGEETLAPGEGIYAYNQNYDLSSLACIPAKVRFVAPTF